MSDLKETKEFVTGAIILAKMLSAQLKDGFQPQDLIEIAKKITLEAEFRESIWEAAKGIQKIPDEIKETPTITTISEIGLIVLDALKA